MKRLLLAAVLAGVSASNAWAVAEYTGPTGPSANAAAIAALVDTYLAASAGATDTGGWFDAAPSGSAPDRGQSLIRPSNFPDFIPAGPGEIHVAAFNNTTEIGIVSFDDGAGGSGTLTALLTQLHVAYTAGVGADFQTFCIDLLHTLTEGQTYGVDLKTDLDTAFTNGARMAYIMANYGDADLSANPLQAAAVQIALWDLSLDNHNPISFQQDADGSYSSGDPNVFKITFLTAVPAPAPPSSAIFCGAVLILFSLHSALCVRGRHTFLSPRQ
jgi:hypothetical protein